MIFSAARIVGLPMDAAPGADEIVERIDEEIAAVAAPVLSGEVLAFGDEFRPARPFGHELHAARAFELERDPHRLLDAAPGGDDAMVAQDQGAVLAAAARHRRPALGRDDEIGS